MYARLLSLFTCLLLAGTIYGQSPDVAVYYLLTPSNCAKTDQTVQFYPMNVGSKTLEGFEARVYKNDELQFTEQVSQVIEPNGYAHVTLGQTVHFDYEEEALVSLRLLAPGDKNSTNDSVTMQINMPRMMPYPYTWSAETSRVHWTNSGLDYLDWQYDAQMDAYYQSDRATNWMGSLISDALPFPEGEPVKCSFEFGTAGGDVTLYFYQDYGDNQVQIDTVMVGQSTEDFTQTYFSFKALGPAVIRISATLGGDWNASGSIYIRNICFSQAGMDLTTKAILSPVGNASAVSSQPLQVAARFSNPSPIDVVNPTFCYDAGWGTVSEVYEGTLKAGQSIDYTFQQTYTCTQPCTQPLKVWCVADGDTDPSNDLLTKSVTYYQPLSFPFYTSFDLQNELWTVVDVNADGQTFIFEPVGKEMTAQFYNYACADIHEQLISPAICIPAGRHRVAFHYAGFKQKGDVNLRLYMGTTPDVSQMTELLFDQDLRNNNWNIGYHLVELPTEQVCYFAFVAKGKEDAIYIDEFTVDDCDDVSITNVSFDTPDGYNLTQANVSISYANFGVNTQQDVALGYTVNGGALVKEINMEELNPGDTLTYTFATLADVSEAGKSYLLKGFLLSAQGDDDLNDEVDGPTLQHHVAQSVPYYNNFNDEERNAQWLMTTNHQDEYSGWKTDYSANAYTCMGLLKHEAWNDTRSDSWAYSEGIQMPKGQYEVSYFHHERNFFSGPEYEQDFEVLMGTQRTPEAMTIQIDKQEKVDVYLDPFQKIIKTINIPADGVYFLGFHNTSKTSWGITFIDDVQIEPVQEGRALPYQSDFTSADTLSWTFYDLNPYSFLQWENRDGVLVAERNDDQMWTYPEGMAISPKLHIKAGASAIATIDYTVDTDDAKATLCLYIGTQNNKSAMTLLQTLPQDKSQCSVNLPTSDAEQDLYLGFRSNTSMAGDKDYSNGPFYTLSIESVTVDYSGAGSITSVTADAPHEVRDLTGRLVSRGSIPAQLKGIYVVDGQLKAY